MKLSQFLLFTCGKLSAIIVQVSIKPFFDWYNYGEWRCTLDTQLDITLAAIRQRILDGEFGTGGRLPPVRMLAREQGVSPDLINKALQRLQAEGLLISRGRTGVFVNKPRPRISNNLALFHSSVEEQGLKAIEETLEGPSAVPAPEHAARALGINEAVPVIYRLRRLGTSTVHYSLLESFYPSTIVDQSMLERMQHDERLDVLSAIKETHGLAAKEIREDILGRFPTQKEQDLLGIVPGTPVQEVNSIYYAEDDKTVILYIRSILIASYFVLSYDYAAPLN